MELAVRLGVDPRKADQIVRGTPSLPAGTGRTARVAVFAAGEKAAEARAAGADVVGADDLVARVANDGFLDFDVAIATPDLMGQVGTLGRVLGPRGLMPNPKTGTVTDDVERAVIEFKGGRVEYRTDKVGNIHLRIGKASFDRAQLLENLHAVMEEIHRAKPASSKGRYVRAVTLSSTMGPGIHIDPLLARKADEELAAIRLMQHRRRRRAGPPGRRWARVSPFPDLANCRRPPVYRSPGTEGTRLGPPDEAFRVEHRCSDVHHSMVSAARHPSERSAEGPWTIRGPTRSPSSTRCEDRLEASDGAVLTEYRGLTRGRAGRAPT